MITRAVIEALDNASRGMDGFMSIKKDDSVTWCTNGVQLWVDGNREHAEELYDTDILCDRLQFEWHDTIMWIFYSDIESVSLTITGAN